MSFKVTKDFIPEGMMSRRRVCFAVERNRVHVVPRIQAADKPSVWYNEQELWISQREFVQRRLQQEQHQQLLQQEEEDELIPSRDCYSIIFRSFAIMLNAKVAAFDKEQGDTCDAHKHIPESRNGWEQQPQ